MSESKARQAIIPAAGWGTRLLPLSHAVPKELLPIGRKPALQWIAEELVRAGIDHLIIVANPDKLPVDTVFRSNPALENFLQSHHKLDALAALWSHGPYAGVRVSVAWQREQLGLGHAVACGRQLLEPGPFAVALGDSVIGPPGSIALMQRLSDAFIRHRAAAAIAFESVALDQVSRYGIADPANDEAVFRLKGIVEKPAPGAAPSNLAVAARYIFGPTIFDAIDATPRGTGGEFQLTDAIRKLIDNGETVVGIRLEDEESRFDLGSYASFRRAFLAFSEHDAPALASRHAD